VRRQITSYRVKERTEVDFEERKKRTLSCFFWFQIRRMVFEANEGFHLKWPNANQYGLLSK
jgi:hypothetical protein